MTDRLPTHLYDVRDFGAEPSAPRDAGVSIQRAIDACADQGGGRVRVGPGEYTCGPLRLRSGVDLHVERGATLRFSERFDDYAVEMAEYEGEPAPRCASPISGDGLTDVSITGVGTIDGSGHAWRPVKKMKRTPQEWADLVASGGVLDPRGEIWWPTESALRGEALVKSLRARGDSVKLEDYLPARDFLRPVMVRLARCTNVIIDGPTFTNSPAWNLHLLLCQRVLVRRATVLNPWWAQNGDGLDLESCSDVRVEESTFDVGDDAICLKSGRDEAGRRRGVPTERVTVERCTVRHGHGGVVVGSEMSGGVRNVTVRDCHFDGTDIGLRFKTTRGRGGVVENVDVCNVTMSNIKNEAIGLNMYYMVKDPAPEPVTERTPRFRRMSFRNVVCTSSGRPLELHGLPEMPVEAVSIERSHLVGKRSAFVAHARDVRLTDVQIESAETPALRVEQTSNLNFHNVDLTASTKEPA